MYSSTKNLKLMQFKMFKEDLFFFGIKCIGCVCLCGRAIKY